MENLNYFDMTAEELATLQRGINTWDPDIIAALADKAGMAKEWAAADGDHAEEVITRIAEKLGVDLW